MILLLFKGCSCLLTKIPLSRVRLPGKQIQSHVCWRSGQNKGGDGFSLVIDSGCSRLRNTTWTLFWAGSVERNSGSGAWRAVGAASTSRGYSRGNQFKVYVECGLGKRMDFFFFLNEAFFSLVGRKRRCGFH